MLLSASLARAAVPHLIRYQGQVVDASGVPLEGPHTLTFRLYEAQTGGTPVWEEVQPNVPLTNGSFSILLGQVTSLELVDWAAKPLWLGVSVNGEKELAPRQRITSVPLAITAERLANSHTISPVNLLKNGSFEEWTEPYDPYNAFPHWSVSGGNYSIVKRSEGVARFGATAAKLTYDGGGHFGNVSQTVDDFAPLRGQSVTFSVWVYAPQPNEHFLVLGIDDGVTSTYHHRLPLTTGTWERFTLTHVVSPQATRLEATTGRATTETNPSTAHAIYIDGAMLVAGPMPFAFSPHPQDAIDTARSVPAGAIILWTGATCPAGYTRVSGLDGKFLVADTTYNAAAGGSNTHTHGAGGYAGPSHTHTIPATSATWGMVGPRVVEGQPITSANVGSGRWAASHDPPTSSSGAGAVTGTSATADNRPAFATVVLCQKD